MNIDYFMKIQNAYGTKNRREKELVKVNQSMSKHFTDTFDTEEVLINDVPQELMIIKDTDGNTYKKKIKSKHNEKFNLGDYVKWNDQIWLITLVDADEKTWNRGYMYLCTITLRWQNSEGKIIERYAYSEDYTKYSGGTTGNNVITIGDNQYGLTLPIDIETKNLKRDMRFPIDFEDAEQPDIYELGNRKVNLSNYEYFGRGGIMTITLSYDAFNRDTDKRVAMDNGKEVWICDYKEIDTNTDSPLPPSPPQNPDEMTDLRAVISGNKNLKVGISRTYTALFTDVDGNAVENVDFSWNVISDFTVEQSIDRNKIELKVDDDSFIDESFILQILIDGTVKTELEITVIGII